MLRMCEVGHHLDQQVEGASNNSFFSRIFSTIYRMAGNFGGEFILVDYFGGRSK